MEYLQDADQRDSVDREIVTEEKGREEELQEQQAD